MGSTSFGEQSLWRSKALLVEIAKMKNKKMFFNICKGITFLLLNQNQAWLNQLGRKGDPRDLNNLT